MHICVFLDAALCEAGCWYGGTSSVCVTTGVSRPLPAGLFDIKSHLPSIGAGVVTPFCSCGVDLGC